MLWNSKHQAETETERMLPSIFLKVTVYESAWRVSCNGFY